MRYCKGHGDTKCRKHAKCTVVQESESKEWFVCGDNDQTHFWCAEHAELVAYDKNVEEFGEGGRDGP